VSHRRVTADDLPVVARNHHVTPHLDDAQGREALSLGLALQRKAAAADPDHVQVAERRRRRRRLQRRFGPALFIALLMVVALLGRWQQWWPTPLH
jgi:hypothetical protein